MLCHCTLFTKKYLQIRTRESPKICSPASTGDTFAGNLRIQLFTDDSHNLSNTGSVTLNSCIAVKTEGFCNIRRFPAMQSFTVKANIMLGKLESVQIRNILSSQILGRLACSDGLQPYIVPVTFAYDGKYIYGQTNEGTKLAIMRKNPSVCFEVDVLSQMNHWESVLVFGRFEELKDKEADKARNILFNRVFSLMTSSTVHAHEHATESGIDDGNRIKYVMYRIRPDRISGRFEKPSAPIEFMES